MNLSAPPVPQAFVWRRFHSLMGIWLVLFLMFHLLTNSQAALWIGDDGSGFVHAANAIRELPYLQVIEIVLLAIPFLVHTIWGVQYLLTAKFNSYQSDGTTPSLEEYPRNKAYTWQRITSWLLLILITFHVVQMRFMDYPTIVHEDNNHYYMNRLENDAGLSSLASRLNVTLYSSEQITQELQKTDSTKKSTDWLEGLKRKSLADGQVIAVSNNFGTAELLMVRETFKSPAMLFLYTVLVLSACFHAFNGLWTFLITWGVTLSPRSQNLSKIIAIILMFIVTFLGMAAIWGTYWINLRQ